MPWSLPFGLPQQTYMGVTCFLELKELALIAGSSSGVLLSPSFCLCQWMTPVLLGTFGQCGSCPVRLAQKGRHALGGMGRSVVQHSLGLPACLSPSCVPGGTMTYVSPLTSQ
jgi:hypothetical protein